MLGYVVNVGVQVLTVGCHWGSLCAREKPELHCDNGHSTGTSGAPQPRCASEKTSARKRGKQRSRCERKTCEKALQTPRSVKKEGWKVLQALLEQSPL